MKNAENAYFSEVKLVFFKRLSMDNIYLKIGETGWILQMSIPKIAKKML